MMVAAAVMTSLTSAASVAADDGVYSVHQLELEQHAGETLAPRVMPQTLPSTTGKDLSRVVYGYYPFWVADLSTIRWDALTHLAWFGVNMTSEGTIDSYHGWPDQDVVDVAHAAGVRVDVTFTLFGNSSIETLCTSASRRATAIDNMVSTMETGNADGISVDFEFVNSDTRQAFVTFIQELRAELNARGHDDAEISIAGPAVDWGEAIDLDALLDAADWYFVMGYGYFWSGSSRAGPIGMLRVTPEWAPFQNHSMVRTIAYYSRMIDADKRRQIIWGVPYYGREWTTASGDIGASTYDSLGAVSYSQSMNDLAGGGIEWLWDEGVAAPWYRWQQNGTWHQVHYADVASLAAKYALALDQDLGGVGMWALNYDKPYSELWDLLQDTFTELPTETEGHRHAPIVIDSLPFHDERDTSEGASHYFNYYSCAPDTPEFGREWVYSIDVCQPGTVLAAVPEYPDRDPDLHLLEAADQNACIDRAHTELEVEVEPGRYLLVVDTYVDMPVELEGTYSLDVDFVPQPGTEGCAGHLSCQDGSCICPTAGTVDCGGSCVDLVSDAAHCGTCGNACAQNETCIAGTCEQGPTQTEAPPQVQSAEGITGDHGGCGCRVAPNREGDGRWLVLLGLAAALRRRPVSD